MHHFPTKNEKCTNLAPSTRQSDDDDDDNNNYATTTARYWSKLSWFAVARITNKKRVAVT